ncbi:hypothetical protein ERJ75_000357500 [Trypanosoma vivax]|uniref:Uncharacterized protein n=1 Tax=Trypanosoma vivax (strain Y486) TaxID=1055687 RepID=G0TZT7_TRYVY|nr:hypothetical protein ERJ75_000357500 [Trypanosoma vivax]CCC50115.1 conserved hypothetical protein [Trypanosoma vivax Y486]
MVSHLSANPIVALVELDSLQRLFTLKQQRLQQSLDDKSKIESVRIGSLLSWTVVKRERIYNELSLCLPHPTDSRLSDPASQLLTHEFTTALDDLVRGPLKKVYAAFLSDGILNWCFLSGQCAGAGSKSVTCFYSLSGGDDHAASLPTRDDDGARYCDAAVTCASFFIGECTRSEQSPCDSNSVQGTRTFQQWDTELLTSLRGVKVLIDDLQREMVSVLDRVSEKWLPSADKGGDGAVDALAWRRVVILFEDALYTIIRGVVCFILHSVCRCFCRCAGQTFRPMFAFEALWNSSCHQVVLIPSPAEFHELLMRRIKQELILAVVPESSLGQMVRNSVASSKFIGNGSLRERLLDDAGTKLLLDEIHFAASQRCKELQEVCRSLTELYSPYTDDDGLREMSYAELRKMCFGLLSLSGDALQSSCSGLFVLDREPVHRQAQQKLDFILAEVREKVICASLVASKLNLVKRCRFMLCDSNAETSSRLASGLGALRAGQDSHNKYDRGLDPGAHIARFLQKQLSDDVHIREQSNQAMKNVSACIGNLVEKYSSGVVAASAFAPLTASPVGEAAHDPGLSAEPTPATGGFSQSALAPDIYCAQCPEEVAPSKVGAASEVTGANLHNSGSQSGISDTEPDRSDLANGNCAGPDGGDHCPSTNLNVALHDIPGNDVALCLQLKGTAVSRYAIVEEGPRTPTGQQNRCNLNSCEHERQLVREHTTCGRSSWLSAPLARNDSQTAGEDTKVTLMARTQDGTSAKRAIDGASLMVDTLGPAQVISHTFSDAGTRGAPNILSTSTFKASRLEASVDESDCDPLRALKKLCPFLPDKPCEGVFLEDINLDDSRLGAAVNRLRAVRESAMVLRNYRAVAEVEDTVCEVIETIASNLAATTFRMHQSFPFLPNRVEGVLLGNLVELETDSEFQSLLLLYRDAVRENQPTSSITECLNRRAIFLAKQYPYNVLDEKRDFRCSSSSPKISGAGTSAAAGNCDVAGDGITFPLSEIASKSLPDEAPKSGTASLRPVEQASGEAVEVSSPAALIASEVRSQTAEGFLPTTPVPGPARPGRPPSARLFAPLSAASPVELQKIEDSVSCSCAISTKRKEDDDIADASSEKCTSSAARHQENDAVFRALQPTGSFTSVDQIENTLLDESKYPCPHTSDSLIPGRGPGGVVSSLTRNASDAKDTSQGPFRKLPPLPSSVATEEAHVPMEHRACTDLPPSSPPTRKLVCAVQDAAPISESSPPLVKTNSQGLSGQSVMLTISAVEKELLYQRSRLEDLERILKHVVNEEAYQEKTGVSGCVTITQMSEREEDVRKQNSTVGCLPQPPTTVPPVSSLMTRVKVAPLETRVNSTADTLSQHLPAEGQVGLTRTTVSSLLNTTTLSKQKDCEVTPLQSPSGDSRPSRAVPMGDSAVNECEEQRNQLVCNASMNDVNRTKKGAMPSLSIRLLDGGWGTVVHSAAAGVPSGSSGGTASDTVESNRSGHKLSPIMRPISRSKDSPLFFKQQKSHSKVIPFSRCTPNRLFPIGTGLPKHASSPGEALNKESKNSFLLHVLRPLSSPEYLSGRLPLPDIPSVANTSTSIRQRYVAYCREVGIKPNSMVVRILPDTPGVFVSRVDTSVNYVGPKGFRPLLYSIRGNIGLEYLDLSHNNLENGEVAELVSVLVTECGAALHYVNLSNNPISLPGGAQLLRLVQLQPSVCTLRVEDTLIPLRMRQSIQEVCDINKAAGK